MARKIKETPLLRGKDAARFRKLIARTERIRATPEEIDRARKAHAEFGFSELRGGSRKK